MQRITRSARVLTVCAALLLPEPTHAQRTTPSVRRFAADSFWTGVWQRGYRSEPDLVVEPRQLLAIGNHLLVLDLGTREILLLEAATGKSIRTLLPKGSGPGEFKRPSQIAPLDNGFAVFDQSELRLSALSFEGALLWDVNGPGLSPTLCVHHPTTITWKLDGSKDAIVRQDTSGRQRSVRSLPWRENEQEQLTTNAIAAGPSASGHCVFARTHGPDFAIVAPNGQQTVHRYIESVPEPEVEVKQQTVERGVRSKIVQVTQRTNSNGTAMKALVVHDTLIVLFAGETDYKYRLLDYYHLPSGRYIHSRKLRLPATAIAAAPNGWFFVAEILEQHSGFFALRPSRTPPPPKPK